VLVSLTPEDVRHAAALAHIALEPDELEALAGDLAGILDHVGRIASLDLGDVPPTSHALDLVNVLGDDVPREPWPREELLRLAPERTADGFLVPPIGA
jgi:aspartyl-tRNA(Asn)/glutamyl-tRNA(Gln) amidotransferase subunit C